VGLYQTGNLCYGVKDVATLLPLGSSMLVSLQDKYVSGVGSGIDLHT
jgi:hypothetical protein